MADVRRVKVSVSTSISGVMNAMTSSSPTSDRSHVRSASCAG